VPGTHEWQWLQSVLQAVQVGGAQLRLPEFDKGRDDRKGTVTAQVDTLVLEGWCLGVIAQPDSLLVEPVNELERDEDPSGVWRGYVNEQIREHYESLWEHVDLWVHLRVPSFTQVVTWRTQQEQQLPASQRMSEPEILRFIQHYERLTRWLWASVPQGPGVVVSLDEAHQVADFSVSA
jgi:D-glycerate 3-kinase